MILLQLRPIGEGDVVDSPRVVVDGGVGRLPVAVVVAKMVIGVGVVVDVGVDVMTGSQHGLGK